MRALILVLTTLPFLPNLAAGQSSCCCCQGPDRTTYYSSVSCRTANGTYTIQESSTISPGEACRLAREHCRELHGGNPSLLCSRDEAPNSNACALCESCCCKPQCNPCSSCSSCSMQVVQPDGPVPLDGPFYRVQCGCANGGYTTACGLSAEDAINNCMNHAGGTPIGDVTSSYFPCPPKALQATCGVSYCCPPKKRCRLLGRIFGRR